MDGLFSGKSYFFMENPMKIIQVIFPLWLTLWLFNIAMEHGPFIDDFPIKTAI